MSRQLHYRFLPEGNDYWQIYALGKVTAHPDSTVEPRVEIHLRPLSRKGVSILNGGKSDGEKLTRQECFRLGEERKVEAGCGAIPGLPIGSIWRHKFFAAHSNSSIYQFNKIRVDLSKAEIVPANSVELASDRFLPWLPQGYVVRIPTYRDTIYIPCEEIFRYFYGITTHCCHLFLNGEFMADVETLYDPDQTSLKNRVAKIKLEEIVEDYDLVKIASLIFSRRGVKEAQQCFTRLLVNGSICVGLPDSVRCELTLLTRSVKTSGKAWAICAKTILGCDVPWPFEQIFPTGLSKTIRKADRNLAPIIRKKSSIDSDNEVDVGGGGSPGLLDSYEPFGQPERVDLPLPIVEKWKFDKVIVKKGRPSKIKGQHTRKKLTTSEGPSDQCEILRHLEIGQGDPEPQLPTELETTGDLLVPKLNQVFRVLLKTYRLTLTPIYGPDFVVEFPGVPVSELAAIRVAAGGSYYYLFEGKGTATVVMFHNSRQVFSEDTLKIIREEGKAKIFANTDPPHDPKYKEITDIFRLRFWHHSEKPIDHAYTLALLFLKGSFSNAR
jgi:hypothetical protein